jgi:FKBP-type peptidyl-prolyl cis-trans isomerase (trigger factor)
MASAYKRGMSGYSEADEAKAEQIARMERRVSSDALRRKMAGEKGIVMTPSEVEARQRSARANYLENVKTQEGRDMNRKNEEFVRSVDLPKANSRAQYDSEKAAGDPYALSMSFEQWKNLD